MNLNAVRGINYSQQESLELLEIISGLTNRPNGMGKSAQRAYQEMARKQF